MTALASGPESEAGRCEWADGRDPEFPALRLGPRGTLFTPACFPRFDYRARTEFIAAAV